MASNMESIVSNRHNRADTPPKSARNQDRASWVVQVGLLSNLGLAVVKLLGGWTFHSKALTADAWHSFTDLTTDALALFALYLSTSLQKTTLRPSTAGKMENVLSLLATGLLVATGVHLGWESVMALRILDRSPDATADYSAPSLQAIWPAALTVFVKEWLYHMTMKVAMETRSPVLASSATQQRADSLMSVVAIVAILGSTVWGDTAWVDSVGGLAISTIMVRAALRSLNASIRALVMGS